MLFFFINLILLTISDFYSNLILYAFVIIFFKNFVTSVNTNFIFNVVDFNLIKVFITTTHFFKSFFKKIVFVTNRTLRWKPLFKRSSYYGIYRSNKNQWLNK